MCKITYLIILMASFQISRSQNNKIMAVNSTNSIASMNAIANPQKGQIVYVNANKSLYYHNGNLWQNFGSSWKTSGNHCVSADADNTFLGTINQENITLKTNNQERIRITDQGLGIEIDPQGKFQVRSSETDPYGNDIATPADLEGRFDIIGQYEGLLHFSVDDAYNSMVYFWPGHFAFQVNGEPNDPKIVTAIKTAILAGSISTPSAFNEWKLEGRMNDLSPWILIHQMSANIPPLPASPFVIFYHEETYSFSNNIAYEDYKLTNIAYHPQPANRVCEVAFIAKPSNASLIVSDAGNVGVNTDTPTEKLHVVGDILSNSYTTPDYVFEQYFEGYSTQADYQFMPLEEKKAFVQKHYHLPGIASAKEIQQQGGVLLNKSMYANLQQIEELYIHLFEINRRIKTLEQLIALEEKPALFPPTGVE